MLKYLNLLTVNSVYDYFSYGKILRSYIANSDEKFGSQHERDAETDLDYRGARFYDSDIARFLSVDPNAASYTGISPYVAFADNQGSERESEISDDDYYTIETLNDGTFNRIYLAPAITGDVWRINVNNESLSYIKNEVALLTRKNL